MGAEFTFRKNPILSVLESSNTLVPGISKVIGIYYSSIQGRVIAECAQDSNVDSLAFDPGNKTILELRKNNSYYSWITNSDLPFSINSKKDADIKIGVFNELNRNVLVLGLRNQSDTLFDLLFFCFNGDFANFGMNNAEKELSVDNKTIIGHLLYNFVSTLVNKYENDSEAFFFYKKTTRNIIDESENSLKRNSKYLIDFSNYFLDEANNNSPNTKFSFSDCAYDKITTYKGSISLLRSIIENAIIFAGTIYSEGVNCKVEIKSIYLDFETEEKKKQITAEQENKESRYFRTIELLDKLQSAAEKLDESQIKLTGKNVGNACSPSITAAAITLSLKKHNKKVLHLLNEHPDRWLTIRSSFKPVRNLFTS